MKISLSFGQKLASGFGVVLLFALIVATISVFSIKKIAENKDKLLKEHVNFIIEIEDNQRTLLRDSIGLRTYLLTHESKTLNDRKLENTNLQKGLDAFYNKSDSEEEKKIIAKAQMLMNERNKIADELIYLTNKKSNNEIIINKIKTQLVPVTENLRITLVDFLSINQRQFELAQAESTNYVNLVIIEVIVFAIGALIAGLITSILLSNYLSKLIASAITRIQSSSTELQATAAQQTTGVKEQVTSMSEISTTIKELVLTAKQIADSAQHVSGIAHDTSKASNRGNEAVKAAQDSILSIKHQVDFIVKHMIDLGKKSQQIGGVLEIINELSEQTNILSINATIEAIGAGEVGKRFSVVADEIRKLADRVGVQQKK